MIADLIAHYCQLKQQAPEPERWVMYMRIDTYARLLPMRRKKIFGYAQRQRRKRRAA